STLDHFVSWPCGASPVPAHEPLDGTSARRGARCVRAPFRVLLARCEETAPRRAHGRCAPTSMLLQTEAFITDGKQGARFVSLYTVVSRGVAGRFGQRSIDAPATTARAEVVDSRVRFEGASMRILEAGLALIAIVTAVLMGVGR